MNERMEVIFGGYIGIAGGKIVSISKSAPKNVKEYMEYIIYTDYWKDFHYLTDKIPLPAGYFCKFIVSLDSETQKGVIHIQYHVSTIPGTYSTSVTE